MVEKLTELIRQENPRRPYTDHELAQRMNIRREQVIKLRLLAQIPDSRERLREELAEDMESLTERHPGLSERKMTEELGHMGYDVSRYLVKRMLKELPGIDLKRCEHKEFSSHRVSSEAGGASSKIDRASLETGRAFQEDAFSSMIGSSRGLKNQINQAKAAVLYPPFGLNTLIIGASGSGKTFLAEHMYRFAIQKQVLAPTAPFVVFNCADYAENPQLLISQLFGHVKGAFSGAKENKKGLVEEADGGYLFLDEVHRLPSEGQELLFYLLDKGEFRRLGDSGTPRKVKVRMIAATTENPESALLLTFRRRIPMIISMPSLNERPPEERHAIIRMFFCREMYQIHRPMVVEASVVKALLTYPCSGNVGQLSSDIQVLCAEAFLSSVSTGRPEVCIRADQLKGMMSSSSAVLEAVAVKLPALVRDLVITPEGAEDVQQTSLQPDSRETKSLYQLIEATFQELGGQNLDQEEILGRVQERINRYLDLTGSEQPGQFKTSLETFVENMVDRSVIQATRHGVDLARQEFPKLREELYSLLAIHLDSVLTNLRAGSYTGSSNMVELQRLYSKEYKTACAIVDLISKELGAAIPREEAGRITIYLKTFCSNVRPGTGRIRVLILTHGQVGVSMAEVVNAVMNTDTAVGMAVELSEPYEATLKHVVSAAASIDEGRGILCLVDMGSLTEIGNVVMKQTGIPVCTISRVDTLLALDAVRRSGLHDADLYGLARALKWSQGFRAESVNHQNGLKPAFITVCLTGEGNAAHLKEYLKSSVLNASDDIAIFELGILNIQKQREEIDRIRREYQILAVMGTLDPEIPGIPFYPMSYVFSSRGLLTMMELIGGCQGKKATLIDVVHSELIFFEPEPTITKNEVIDNLCARMEENGSVLDGFLLSIYKREMMGDTCLAKEGLAVPHGDSLYVTKPAIAIAKLIKPVLWSDEHVADLVFLFAFDNGCKNYAEKFSCLTEDKQRISGIRHAKSREEILKYINF